MVRYNNITSILSRCRCVSLEPEQLGEVDNTKGEWVEVEGDESAEVRDEEPAEAAGGRFSTPLGGV